ncbi:unnamed protein product [Rhizophagus irregularis]|nr:unnamed protein product [Rhizophagus irregularis]
MIDEPLTLPLCNKCKKREFKFNDWCGVCYEAKELFIPSGNKVIDDFISYTLTNGNEYGRMIFVPYDKFKNIELIGEGGFSKIYKATWIDYVLSLFFKSGKNKSINAKFDFVHVYYGITQDPTITQDLIFVMPYYNSDLTHYITKDFYNISWYDKIHIGPVTTNNPGAVYKSRYLSDMIKSAASTRSLKSNLLLQKVYNL